VTDGCIHLDKPKELNAMRA